jgi:hypothetical protein
MVCCDGIGGQVLPARGVGLVQGGQPAADRRLDALAAAAQHRRDVDARLEVGQGLVALFLVG